MPIDKTLEGKALVDSVKEGLANISREKKLQAFMELKFDILLALYEYYNNEKKMCIDLDLSQTNLSKLKKENPKFMQLDNINQYGNIEKFRKDNEELIQCADNIIKKNPHILVEKNLKEFNFPLDEITEELMQYMVNKLDKFVLKTRTFLIKRTYLLLSLGENVFILFEMKYKHIGTMCKELQLTRLDAQGTVKKKLLRDIEEKFAIHKPLDFPSSEPDRNNNVNQETSNNSGQENQDLNPNNSHSMTIEIPENNVNQEQENSPTMNSHSEKKIKSNENLEQPNQVLNRTLPNLTAVLPNITVPSPVDLKIISPQIMRTFTASFFLPITSPTASQNIYNPIPLQDHPENMATEASANRRLLLLHSNIEDITGLICKRRNYKSSAKFYKCSPHKLSITILRLLNQDKNDINSFNNKVSSYLPIRLKQNLELLSIKPMNEWVKDVNKDGFSVVIDNNNMTHKMFFNFIEDMIETNPEYVLLFEDNILLELMHKNAIQKASVLHIDAHSHPRSYVQLKNTSKNDFIPPIEDIKNIIQSTDYDACRKHYKVLDKQLFPIIVKQLSGDEERIDDFIKGVSSKIPNRLRFYLELSKITMKEWARIINQNSFEYVVRALKIDRLVFYNFITLMTQIEPINIKMLNKLPPVLNKKLVKKSLIMPTPHTKKGTGYTDSLPEISWIKNSIFNLNAQPSSQELHPNLETSKSKTKIDDIVNFV